MAEEKTEEKMEDFAAALERTMKNIAEGDLVKGTVSAVEDEYVLVDLNYFAPGIIRATDLSDDPHFKASQALRVGDEVEAEVLSMDDGKGNILLSRKAASQETGWDRIAALKEKDAEVDVRISEAVHSGVVAYLEDIRGFIPASGLSLTYVPDEELDSYVGKTVTVKIIDCDRSRGKLVMSGRDILRRMAEEQRAEVISNMQPGLVTEGVVSGIKDYGAFVDLSNGATGLVHVSQISNERIAHPGKVLKVGQKVKVKVIAIKDGKVSLSMKALEDEQAQAIEEEHIDLPESEAPTTSLADLLKKAGF